MRLVFLGTPEAAVPSLLRLRDAGHVIASVVTRPDRPVGRSRTPAAPPVKRTKISREELKTILDWYRTQDPVWLSLDAAVKEYEQEAPVPEQTVVYAAKPRGTRPGCTPDRSTTGTGPNWTWSH